MKKVEIIFLDGASLNIDDAKSTLINEDFVYIKHWDKTITIPTVNIKTITESQENAYR